MKFQLDQALEVLSQTPSVLDALLRSKSPAWLDCRKSPEAFSPRDVVAHLILADQTNWVPRARFLVMTSDPAAFPTFDRFAFQSILAGKSISELLDEFALQRRGSLHELTELRLTEASLALEGKHPELGPVTLGNLLATWVVHDLTHIRQIVTTMANEYREAVGPWEAYLSILH